jgi:hypothetical protein
VLRERDVAHSTCGAANPKVNAVTPPRTKVRRDRFMPWSWVLSLEQLA